MAQQQDATGTRAPIGWSVCTLCYLGYTDDIETPRVCSACKGTKRVHGPLKGDKSLWLEVTE